MKIVTLKNGREVPEGAVKAIMINIKSLWGTGIPGMLAICDLHEICKGNNPAPYGDNLKKLKDFALLSFRGRWHRTINDSQHYSKCI